MEVVKIRTYAIVEVDEKNNITCERGLSLHQAKIRATKRRHAHCKPTIFRDEDIIMMAGETPVVPPDVEVYWRWDSIDEKWKMIDKKWEKFMK